MGTEICKQLGRFIAIQQQNRVPVQEMGSHKKATYIEAQKWGEPLIESSRRNWGNFQVRVTGRLPCLSKKEELAGERKVFTFEPVKESLFLWCMFRFKKNNDSHGPIQADAKHAAKCSLSAF